MTQKAYLTLQRSEAPQDQGALKDCLAKQDSLDQGDRKGMLDWLVFKDPQV